MSNTTLHLIAAGSIAVMAAAVPVNADARQPFTDDVASRTQALALLEQGSDAFDLLITDHMMPHMSGPQLAARALTLCPGLQVLIVSGFGEVDSAATAFARLAKPFDQQSLARALAGLQLV